MAQDKKLTEEKLTELWEDKKIKVPSTKNRKYVIFSDLHLGDGGGADDFIHNRQTMLKALEYYYKNDFTLILLGDIEEFWQFDFATVKKQYDDNVYSKMREFGNDRVYRVFGNHDYEWHYPQDPAMADPKYAQGAPEALKLKYGKGEAKILLVHGHQGNIESDKNSWISKFVVRGFKQVEPIARFLGLYGHPSATKSQVTEDYERIMYGWAKENEVILICGHSHRAIFAAKSYAEKLRDNIDELEAINLANRKDKKLVKKNLKIIRNKKKLLEEEKHKGRDIDPTESEVEPVPCYFNSGCGLYTDGITNLEIADGEIRLIKWHRTGTEDQQFDVYDSMKLSDISFS
ncbi:MAG: metallophosphoesterase family protein [Candidatus Cloacimonetes bacterium]|nr:metallophosphoesterase family protein [Candidatus Cloacimonadota bacterium]